MAKYYIVSRPKKSSPLRYSDLLDDSGSDWHAKARNLRMRRWRTLKRTDNNKQLHEQEQS